MLIASVHHVFTCFIFNSYEDNSKNDFLRSQFWHNLEHKNILYVSMIIDRENLDEKINDKIDILCNKIILWIENILLENKFSENKAKEIAAQIFSTIIGASIFSKNKNIEIFDKIIKNKISEIVYISRFF